MNLGCRARENPFQAVLSFLVNPPKVYMARADTHVKAQLVSLDRHVHEKRPLKPICFTAWGLRSFLGLSSTFTVFVPHVDIKRSLLGFENILPYPCFHLYLFVFAYEENDEILLLLRLIMSSLRFFQSLK